MGFVAGSPRVGSGAGPRRSSICGLVKEVQGSTPYTLCSSGYNVDVALLLIHPIGVGLSRRYWRKFLGDYDGATSTVDVYAPDLIGCGENKKAKGRISLDMICDDLETFIEEEIKKPVILLSEGALAGATIELAARLEGRGLRGVILSTPPAIQFFSIGVNKAIATASWTFFSSPLGVLLFYYVRRREFLKNFTEKNLFTGKADEDWLDDLEGDAKDIRGRWAVFSFLASEWRKDFRPKMAQIESPTLMILGDQIKIISNSTFQDSVEKRFDNYGEALPWK
ncbi:hypothetical protein NDN08_002516 [Rhodosorus marinus]|uniref:AB hydrolase-1 domain-containing protein n=1 Tax=Rhodosorus marinus TaxID=101924 RepID=A0AAV8UWQ9_9RHOD|nr:hypothetical protein NDN08_002516 [Rhodosorus marinus]